jgi:hypothetical protein
MAPVVPKTEFFFFISIFLINQELKHTRIELPENQLTHLLI